jgi:hypothetical protein
VWVHHSDSVHQTTSVVKDNNSMSDDRMDEMLDVIRLEFGIGPKERLSLDL